MTLADDDLVVDGKLGFFVTKVFHPNVSEAGEICVNTLKKDWKPTHGIDHVLTVRTLCRQTGSEFRKLTSLGEFRWFDAY